MDYVKIVNKPKKAYFSMEINIVRISTDMKAYSSRLHFLVPTTNGAKENFFDVKREKIGTPDFVNISHKNI